jgi:truncated hemoglobin YjbI
MTTRIGDAQRTEVLNLLGQALEEVYLDLGEYDQRITAATAAETADQLVDQVADLPR